MAHSTKPANVDEYADLRERADKDYPTAWRPEADGAELVGRFARLEQAPTQDYGWAHVAVIIDANGEEHSIWLFHTALISQFARLAPQVGDRILVRYMGRKKAKSGTFSYADYRVVTEQGEQRNIDWSGLLPAPLSTPGLEEAASDVQAPAPANDDDPPFLAGPR